jgi:hypothetical protein
MTLVVDMEAVIHGMILEFGHVPGHVDDGHGSEATGEG